MMGAAIAGIAGAAAGGSMAVLGAKEQNEAIGEQMKADAEAAAQKQSQLVARSGLQRLKRMRAAEQIEGSLRAKLAGAGDASGEALARQNLADAAMDLQIMRINTATGIRSIQSNLAAQTARLRGQIQNPLLIALAGGAGGFAQGVQIGEAGAQITGPDGFGWWGDGGGNA